MHLVWWEKRRGGSGSLRRGVVEWWGAASMMMMPTGTAAAAGTRAGTGSRCRGPRPQSRGRRTAYSSARPRIRFAATTGGPDARPTTVGVNGRDARSTVSGRRDARSTHSGGRGKRATYSSDRPRIRFAATTGGRDARPATVGANGRDARSTGIRREGQTGGVQQRQPAHKIRGYNRRAGRAPRYGRGKRARRPFYGFRRAG
jgi:hypothetical protein